MCIKSQHLPHLLVWEDPVEVSARGMMDFRLVYAGELLRAQGSGGGKNRAWEKHQIRLHFHNQLRNLWATHPLLVFYNQPSHFDGARGLAGRAVLHHLHQTTVESLAERYEGYVPLVNGDHGMYCDLDVLFLRAEPVGGLLKHNSGGGDIDNRIKVLFDALGIPQRGQLRPRQTDEPDPSPVFVLLSDDSLITSVRVTTDRLLTTQSDDPAEACLIIHVHVKSIDPLAMPYGRAV